MFNANRPTTYWSGFFVTLNLIFETTVRSMRSGNRNAIVGLAKSILLTVAFLVAFQLLFQLLGMRTTPLRGEFILFMMSGIFMFLTHVKAVGAVAGADGPTSPMLQHAPMNSIISICGSALSCLYIQFMAMVCILMFYHAAIKPISIDDPIGALGMFLVAWGSGCAVGIMFMGMRPWLPTVTSLLTTVYQRANMIASGKMLAANTLPASALILFSWNPLFHTIDQTRGFVFINYTPHKTWLLYPIIISVILISIGLMLEFFNRHRVSVSWSAGR